MLAPVRSPETRHRVHFQDCDMLGHLNNARYLDYFLNAREDQVAAHYDLNMGELAREQQAAWVVTKHHISYLKPARQGVEVRIGRWPAPAGPALVGADLRAGVRCHPPRPF